MGIQGENIDRVVLLKPYFIPSVIGTVICLGMLFIGNGIEVRFQRAVNFEIIMMIALAVFVFLAVNKVAGLLCLYVTITYPFHLTIDATVKSVLTAMMCWYIFIAMCSRYEQIKIAEGRWYHPYNFLCLAILLNVAFQGMQKLNLPVPFCETGYNAVGLMGNTNDMSTMIAVSLPAFFYGRWKWLIPVPLIGLLLGQSTGGVAAVFVAGVVWLIINQKKILGMTWEHKRAAFTVIALAVVITFIGVVNIYRHTPNIPDRIKYWTEMAPTLDIHPYKGWGLGQFKYAMPLVQFPAAIPEQIKALMWQNVGDKDGLNKAVYGVVQNIPDYYSTIRWKEVWLEAHNDYWEIWWSLGIFGLIGVLATIYVHLKKGQGIPFYGFLISCVSACWFFSWQVIPISIVTVFYAGMIAGE